MLLRKVRRGRWLDPIRDNDAPLPADPLADITTTGNSLSVWHVEADYSNLEDVVVGLAATLSTVSNIDLAIIDEAALEGFTPQKSAGKTPLTDAVPYHRDIGNLLANDIVELCRIFAKDGDFRYSFTQRQVAELLAKAIKDGRLELEQLDERIRVHLQKKNLL